MWANGAEKYTWKPSVTLIESNGSLVQGKTEFSVPFIVTGTDRFGCVAKDTVQITTFPKPSVQANTDVYASTGDLVQLSAVTSSTGTVSWSPPTYLSCVTCLNPIANPDKNTGYTVLFTDQNGCVAKDVVQIWYEPVIYIPNAFTPDGDQFNGLFLARGSNISTFGMEIYNRWGEIIFTCESLDDGWDGTYNNLPSPDGVYTWKIRYSDFLNNVYEGVGHVTLLR